MNTKGKGKLMIYGCDDTIVSAIVNGFVEVSHTKTKVIPIGAVATDID